MWSYRPLTYISGGSLTDTIVYIIRDLIDQTNLNQLLAFSDPAVRVDEASRVREEAGFFGVPGQEIFGVRYLPPGEPKGAVVICCSIHAELLSSYHSEVVLARSLAARGFAVQRFHYRGMGHSSGDPTHVTFDSMVQDATAAKDALVEAAGPALPTWVGTRWGALTAASASAEGDAIVLWEPVLSTKRYWKEVQRFKLMHEMSEGPDREQSQEDSPTALLESGRVAEILGYQIQPELFQSGVGRELVDELGTSSRRVLLVQMSNRSELTATKDKFKAALVANGSSVDVAMIADEPIWWLLRPPIDGLDELVDVTTKWVDR